jgi:hypothetical protein
LSNGLECPIPVWEARGKIGLCFHPGVLLSKGGGKTIRTGWRHAGDASSTFLYPVLREGSRESTETFTQEQLQPPGKDEPRESQNQYYLPAISTAGPVSRNELPSLDFGLDHLERDEAPDQTGFAYLG